MRTWSPRITRTLLGIFAALGLSLALGACGSAYTPVKEGKCAPGRVWVEPHQDENGHWVEGRCAWPDEVEKK